MGNLKTKPLFPGMIIDINRDDTYCKNYNYSLTKNIFLRYYLLVTFPKSIN